MRDAIDVYDARTAQFAASCESIRAEEVHSLLCEFLPTGQDAISLVRVCGSPGKHLTNGVR